VIKLLDYTINIKNYAQEAFNNYPLAWRVARIGVKMEI